jgi:hypothetical protein
MPVYRKVQTSFWQDPFVLELPFEEKAFYLYLITNSKTKQCGIYETSIKIMELETNLEYSKIDSMLKKFEDRGKIKMDNDTKEILIINWTKNNYNASPKVQKCISKELVQIKSKNLKDEYDTIVKKYINTNDVLSQEEKEEEKKEKEEEDKEALLFKQETELFILWNVEPNDQDRIKSRRLLIKYGFHKVKDAFNKAADLGIHSCNLIKVENLLKEM